MASGFQFDGIVSGLKTGDIVASLMAIERRPLTALQNQKTREQARQAAWAAIKTSFSALQSAAQKLTLRSTVNARSVTTDTPSTSPAVLSAVANADAAVGSFQVRVSQLATQTTARSGALVGAQLAGTDAITAAVLNVGIDVSLQKDAGGADQKRFFTVNGAKIELDPTVSTVQGLLDNVAQELNAKLTGTTWSVDLVNDASTGFRPRVRIAAADGRAIHLGAAGDTSNFLSALNLLGANQDGNAITSTLPVAGTRTSEPIKGNAARLATPITGLVDGQGKFAINGVQIKYAETDSVNAIIGRINASNAGVRASYDASQDRLVLTNIVTGSQGLRLEDVTGNFLAAVGLTDATANVQYGQNAALSVTVGGTTTSLTSASNTVSNAIPGVTLNLLRVPDTESPVTVTVSQDAESTKTALQEFVSAFNGVLDAITKQTTYNQETKQGSPLTGDSTLMGLERQLRSLVSSPVLSISGGTATYRTLADIGVSTGKIGSAVGTTRQLQLNESKLKAALADNPQAVETLLAGLLASADGLSPGGTAALSAIAGRPTNTYENGTYRLKMLADGKADLFFKPESGSEFRVKAEVAVAVGENTSLVSGMKLTIASTAEGAESTFRVSVEQRGVMVWIKSRLDAMLGGEGLFAARDTGSSTQMRQLDERIRHLEDRLAEKEESLYRKFAALEAAMARSQSQSSAISATLAQLNSSSKQQ